MIANRTTHQRVHESGQTQKVNQCLAVLANLHRLRVLSKLSQEQEIVLQSAIDELSRLLSSLEAKG